MPFRLDDDHGVFFILKIEDEFVRLREQVHRFDVCDAVGRFDEAEPQHDLGIGDLVHGTDEDGGKQGDGQGAHDEHHGVLDDQLRVREPVPIDAVDREGDAADAEKDAGGAARRGEFRQFEAICFHRGTPLQKL